MHPRRLSAFLIGSWLLGGIFMFVVATQNFKGVDRLLDVPSAAATKRLDMLGKEDTRLLLRYQVSELNRFYFSVWERFQLVLGAILVLITLRGSQRIHVLVIPVAMLVMVAVGHWVLSPEINRLGALMDFVPDSRDTPAGATFWRYHQAYSALEVAKFLLGTLFASFLLIRRRNRNLFRKKVQPEVKVVHNT